MKVTQQSAAIVSYTPDGLDLIERAARVCYQSEPTPGTRERFLKSLIRRGHMSVFEHASASARIVTDRAIANELTRHRIASFSQESTRYCAYSEHVTFVSFGMVTADWLASVTRAESEYKAALRAGQKAEMARDILPLCTKTELYMTANLREWRHIFELRCAKAAHPKMRVLMRPLLRELIALFPPVFADIGGEL